jgi:hypothetical protein
VLTPLVEFCRDPWRAPDLTSPGVIRPQPVRRRRGRAEQRARRAVDLYRREGAAALARRVAAKARRLAAKARRK